MTKPAYTAARMVREIRRGSGTAEKLGWVFEHTDKIQREGYEREDILQVLREIVQVVRGLEIIIRRPMEKAGHDIVNDLIKKGWHIALGAFYDALSENVVTGIKGVIQRNPRPGRITEAMGAKKAGAKKVGAKKVGAKKVGAKKVGAKKVGAKKVGAKKVGAKKAGAKKAAAKKAAAKKAAAKKAGPKTRTVDVLVFGRPR